MFGFLSLFFNIPMLIAVLALAAVAAGIYFTLGPVKLIQIALNWKTWLVVAAIFGGIALWHSSTKIAEQQTQIDTAAVIIDSGKDSQAVITTHVQKKEKRQVQQNTEQAVIDQAPVGEELDALMDEIAREQAVPAAPGK